MKIAFYTLGCKLNQAEADELKENLQDEGFFVVGWKTKANIHIINACGLTAGAEQGTRQIIRQAKRRNPKAKIFVTGCFGQKLAEVDYYSKNIAALLKKIKRARQSCLTDGVKHGAPENRTRAFIKIQTGCDNFCTYCIIPRFRGKPRGISDRKIIRTINQKVARSFREIILTGVNICKYDWRGIKLSGLVRKILNETKIKRIRFGSLDPSLIDDYFINLFRDPRLMPHFHLSLQSGSNKILKLMNRKYTAEDFLSLVKNIRKQYSLAGFTTDIIVGFPGETEKDFSYTCDLVRKSGFLKVHIFPFSPRPGTAAEKMDNQIAEKIKKRRLADLSKIANAARDRITKKIIGKILPVLFEEKKDGFWFGYAPNYLRVKFPTSENIKNKIIDIKITGRRIDRPAA